MAETTAPQGEIPTRRQRLIDVDPKTWSTRLVESVIRAKGNLNRLALMFEEVQRAVQREIAEDRATKGPVSLLLFCPACGLQHVDEATETWANPPHRSHLCLGCGHIWRPADVATIGVAAIATRGENDSAPAPAPGYWNGDARTHPLRAQIEAAVIKSGVLQDFSLSYLKAIASDVATDVILDALADGIKSAYLDGWADREADLTAGLDRILPSPAASAASSGGQRLRHPFKPHRKYPWFCSACGYGPDEDLLHEATT